MKKETLTTIAERTGFSITTISRSLSGKAEQYRISAATVETIRKEAARCGYDSGRKSHRDDELNYKTIGLMLPSISNPYFADLASVTISELSKIGYSIIIMDTMESSQKLMEGIRSLIARKVEGIIAVPCGEYTPEIDTLGKEIPIVLMDRFYEESPIPYVATNNYQGAFEATNKLIAKGHRKIACIQGVEASMPNKERIKGFMDAMNGAGLGDEASISGDEFSIQNGYTEMKLLLEQPDRPSAIFALSNTILMGAFKAIKEAGLRIPEDIAMIGFDDNEYLDYLSPSIYRVGQPLESMATLAVKILMDKISGGNHFNSRIRLAPAMIPGDSL